MYTVVVLSSIGAKEVVGLSLRSQMIFLLSRPTCCIQTHLAIGTDPVAESIVEVLVKCFVLFQEPARGGVAKVNGIARQERRASNQDATEDYRNAQSVGASMSEPSKHALISRRVALRGGASTRSCGLNSGLKGAFAAIFSPTRTEIHYSQQSAASSLMVASSWWSYQLCSRAISQQCYAGARTTSTIVVGYDSLPFVDTDVQAWKPWTGSAPSA